MADTDLFSEPSENSGPAVLDREPIVLPKMRKNFVNKAKDTLGMD